LGTDFLKLDDVLRIHVDQINRYGGRSQVHAPSMLFSALAMPRATFDGNYLHRDVFEQAAAILFHIVQNHPFTEGNKRTGAVAALVFLDLNGVDVTVGEDELFEIVMDVAQGISDKTDVANFLRTASRASELR
jgi:death-on-curing protein